MNPNDASQFAHEGNVARNSKTMSDLEIQLEATRLANLPDGATTEEDQGGSRSRHPNFRRDSRQFVREGDVILMRLPYSEVCMHMRVAGQVRPVLVVEDGAQILNADGTKFSSPVTTGEAGIYRDAALGRYYVPGSNVMKHLPRPQQTVILYVYRMHGERRIECATDMSVQAAIQQFGRDCKVNIEQDAFGRRYRVICSPGASVLLGIAPSVRLAAIARRLGVPASIED